MKKILSFILVLAMVLGCVSMVTFASETNEPLTGIKATANISGQNKAYYLNNCGSYDTIEEEVIDGVTCYYILLQFRVYNLSGSDVNIGPTASGGWNNPIDGVTYGDRATSAQTVKAKSYADYTLKVPVTKNGTKYQITGTTGSSPGTKDLTNLQLRWDFSGNWALGLELVFRAFTPAAVYFCERMGDTVYSYTNEKIYGTDYYENEIDIPVLGGGYISVSNRTTQNSDARINLLESLEDVEINTSYYFTGWFRWHEMQFPAQKLNVLLEISDGTSTKYIAIGATATNDGWFKVSGTIKIQLENLTKAILRVQTWAGQTTAQMNDALVAGYDMDAVSLRKIDADGKYGDNIVKDYNCNLGADTDWYSSSAVIINPEATPTNVSIKTNPNKLEYIVGETLDTTGLTLSVTYPNGGIITVTEGFEVTGFDSTTVGEKTVTVSYKGISTTFTVNVQKPLTGYEFVSTKVLSGSHYGSLQDVVWQADPTFTGKKTVSYTFYNTGSDKVTVSMNFIGPLPTWSNTGTVSAKIEPGQKITLTMSLDFVDGVTTINTYTGVTLDKVSVRFDLTFANEKTDGTSKVLIAPTVYDENDFLFLTKRSINDTSKVEYRGELPEFGTPTPKPTATPTPVPTATPIPHQYQAEGGYLHYTNNVNQNSGLYYKLLDEIKANGNGKYYFQGYFRFPNSDSSKKMVVLFYNTDGTITNYSAVGAATISHGDWVFVSGTVVFDDYAETGWINASDLTNAYLRIQMGTKSEDNWDYDFDGIYFGKMNDDGTLGANLVNDPNCELIEGSKWSASSATLTNPEKKFVVTAPTKNEYNIGETFDATGLQVSFTYGDGSSATIASNKYTVTGFDSTTTGEKTITVSYSGYTATFKVTVIDRPYKAVKLVSDGSGYFVSARGMWAHEEGFTGYKQVSYTFYNPGNNKISVKATPQVLHQNSWETPAGVTATEFTLVAKTSYTITFNVYFENGFVTATKNEITGQYKSSDMFIRMDFPTFTAGDTLYIEDTRDDVKYLFGTPVNFSIGELTNVYEVPTFEKTTGMHVKMTADVSNSHKYFRLNKLGLAPDAIQEDANGRYIYLKYRVYNLSGKEARLYFGAYAGSKVNGNREGWESIDGITYPENINGYSEQTIPAYSSLVYSIRIPINENGKVVISCATSYPEWHLTEHDLSSIAVRFGVNAGADRKLYTGQEFYIQALNDESLLFLNATPEAPFASEGLIQGTDAYNSIKGAQLQVGASFALNYTAMVQHGAENVQLKVTRGDYVSYLNPVSFKYGKVVFDYTGINAQCLADNIDVELICDGKTVAIMEGYSVKQYATNMFGKTAEEIGVSEEKATALKQLLANMLVYGKEAQLAIVYKTDALATAGLETEIEKYAKDYDVIKAEAVISENNTAIAGATLNISHVNKIRFRIADGVEVDSVTINGQKAKVVGNYVYTEAIYATEFDVEYTIVVKDAQGNESSVTYCANVYISTKIDSTKEAGSTTTGALCQALNNYGQSAVAYKG